MTSAAGPPVVRGGLGVRFTLAGTIERGEGAGDRIVATSEARLTTFHCRIVAEPARGSPQVGHLASPGTTRHGGSEPHGIR